MNTPIIKCSVPGNLLLFGEYFITQPNNKGVCMAINTRATLSISVLPQSVKNTLENDIVSKRATIKNILSLESKFENHTRTWKTPHTCKMFAIAEKLFEEYKPVYQNQYPKENVKNSNNFNVPFIPRTNVFIHASIDTNNFFSNSLLDSSVSTKLGIGSSDASAILCCVLVLIINNINPFVCLDILAQHASQTHFLWQDRKGSGYGIYTSIYGGMGIFTKQNQSIGQGIWENLTFPKSIYWYLFSNNTNVSSRKAIVKFKQWFNKNSREALDLQRCIEKHIIQYPLNETSTHLTNNIISWFYTARNIGVALGKSINENAEISKELSNLFGDEIVWKSTGAGNENAIGLSIHDFAWVSQKCTSQKHTLHRSCIPEQTKCIVLDTNVTIIPIQIDDGLRWYNE